MMKTEQQLEAMFDKLGKEFDLLYTKVLAKHEVDPTDEVDELRRTIRIILTQRDTILWVLGVRNQL